MSTWRSIWTALALWCFFGWVYVVVRLLNVGFEDPFVDGLPITFWMLGIGFFILGLLATVGALRNAS